MKNYLAIIAVLFLILPLTSFSATVTPVGDTRTERNNILPQTGIYTVFSNDTSGLSESYPLGAKIRCHTWTIGSDKTTADITWTVDLEGSLDDSLFEDLDTTSTVSQWKREISNKGANYVRSNVLRTYTGTRPTITVTYQGGCN